MPNFFESTPSNSAFKKALIALFSMILGKHSGSVQCFWGIFSQNGISQKLAHKDLFIGSLRYCFHALKCIPGIWLTSRNSLVKLLSLFVRDCTLFTFHYLAFVSHDFFLYLSAVVTCDKSSSSIFQTTTTYTLHQ